MDSRAQKLGAAFRAGVAFYRGHALAQDAAQWITVHPHGKGLTAKGEKAKGQPVLIDGQTGEVLGGMGGKFKGRHISAVRQNGKYEQHGAQQAIEYYKSRESIEAARKAKEEKAKAEEASKAKRPRDVKANFQDAVLLNTRDILQKYKDFDFQERIQRYIDEGMSVMNARLEAQSDADALRGALSRRYEMIEQAKKDEETFAQQLEFLSDADFEPGSDLEKKQKAYLDKVDELESYDLNERIDQLKKEGKTPEEAEREAANERHSLAFSAFNQANALMRDYEAATGKNLKRALKEKREKPIIDAINARRTYTDSEIGQKVKEVFEKHRKNLTEVAAQEAGTLTFDSFSKLPVIEKLNAMEGELAMAELEYREVSKKADFNSPEGVQSESYKKAVDLWAKQNEIRSRVSAFRAEAAREVGKFVAQIRPANDLSDAEMLKGFSSPRRTPTKDTLMEAQRNFPKEWVQGFLDRGKLVTKKVSRGYFMERPGADDLDTIALSGDGVETLVCAIHELGHRLERSNPLVRQLEEQFYNRRTKGEELQSMRRVTGLNYSPKEKTRKDRFLSPYMGKDYGGRSYELVSMGLQMLYTEPHRLMQDPDYAKFILGIVALA